MKRNKIIIFLATSLFSILALNSLPNQNVHPVKADGDWQIENTKALITNSIYMHDGSDSYIRLSVRPSDYNLMDGQYKYVGELTYYNHSDYNFVNYIELSNDNETYIPFSNIYLDSHLDYFFSNGDFRVSLRRNSPTIEQDATYTYIKILAGCEFPSYDYAKNGTTKKKYVQEETTISKLSSNVDKGTYGLTTYSEFFVKPTMTFTGIAPGWNNANYGNPKYNELILQFGVHGTDYLANDHMPDATNRATQSYEIGTKLTINGLPIYSIKNKCATTSVDYAHGYAYLHICYPIELLMMNKNNLVPTLHIEEGTEFIDVLLPELTLKLLGGNWIVSNNDEFKIESPVDIDDYALVDFPHHVGNESHALLNNLPASGVKLAFSIDSGDIDLTNGANAFILDGLYNTMIVIYPSSGLIQLLDHDNSNAVVSQFEGFKFSTNTKYFVELEVICESSSTSFKFAINHLLLLNGVSNINKAKSCALWTIDTSNAFIIDYYEELESYKPVMNYGGSSVYDFIEGDAIYNFNNVVTGFDLYSDNPDEISITYEYEEGAVTNNKYNAGNWTLTITLTAAGYEPNVKEVAINVHSVISTATIYYDEGEPFNVPIGSKLTPPPNPSTYREGEYDYVFDGWYFNGAKWDFENDVVEGDMHLVSHYKAVSPHYMVTVSFEGINRNNETYSLTKGSELPFVLFELEGATFEVYQGDNKITSLIVNDDINITVKYVVIYTYIEAKEATCTEDGNVGYWYSPVYGNYYFADSEGKELIRDAILPKLNHDIVHLDYQDSSCHELGNIECYYCNNCHKHFTDENGEFELENWSIAKKPHVLTHHDRKEATCTEDGNVEYWSCANEEGIYYGNEECSIVLDSVIINAFGHDYLAPTYNWEEIDNIYCCVASIKCVHCQNEIREVKAPVINILRMASCSQEGQISYSVRFDDERFNAQTKIVKTPKAQHNYVHYDEVVATSNNKGVKEHYECSVCHKCFVKNNDQYIETEYSSLIYEYSETVKKCGGNIVTTSLLLFIMSGTFSMLLLLKRKEER